MANKKDWTCKKEKKAKKQTEFWEELMLKQLKRNKELDCIKNDLEDRFSKLKHVLEENPQGVEPSNDTTDSLCAQAPKKERKCIGPTHHPETKS